MNDAVAFIKLAKEQCTTFKSLSFHGGEPFLYIKHIDEYLEQLVPALGDDMRYFITTNGSMIAENEWFFEKWGNRITITLSYDFNYQEVNREAVDLTAIARIIEKYNSSMMFQFVVPTNIPDAYGEDTIAEVIRSARLAHCDTINIIPLRHYRGKEKFKVLIDDIDLKWWSVNFMRFIQTLYVQGLKVNIDGNYAGIEKDYLSNHSKLILSPDGYIYPEFDYLEYQRSEYRTGRWAGTPELYRNRNEDELLLSGCVACDSRHSCGLKYLYAMFEETPAGNCVEFYKIIDLMVKHLHKLKTKPTLMHWIGYDDF
jgi:sulfatase maturation enzyme AslB (radical SAM superfamily)